MAKVGLADRSPRDIRKSGAELNGLEGVSQYHIMAVDCHTQAATGEIYTKGVNRTKLAAATMRKMTGLEGEGHPHGNALYSRGGNAAERPLSL